MHENNQTPKEKYEQIYQTLIEFYSIKEQIIL